MDAAFVVEEFSAVTTLSLGESAPANSLTLVIGASVTFCFPATLIVELTLQTKIFDRI